MSGSRKALAMWGAQQLTRRGKAIPDSTRKVAGNGYATALASAQTPTKKIKKSCSI